MSIRQRLPLWLLVMVALAGAAAGELAHRRLHRAEVGPQTIQELRQRLQHFHPSWHVVQASDVAEEGGFYLCVRPLAREQLRLLLRCREHARRWKGVVFCERRGSMTRIPEVEVDSWGEHGMQLGSFVIFGDPALLDCIRKTMLPARGG